MSIALSTLIELESRQTGQNLDFWLTAEFTKSLDPEGHIYSASMTQDMAKWKASLFFLQILQTQSFKFNFILFLVTWEQSL